MPDQKPQAPPPAKGSKKSIVQADAESRPTKEAVVKKSSKRARQVPKTAELVATEPQVTTSIEKTVMDPKMTMQVPDSVRELAEKTVGQAERAFDAFLSAAQQSVAMIPNPANEM